LVAFWTEGVVALPRRAAAPIRRARVTVITVDDFAEVLYAHAGYAPPGGAFEVAAPTIRWTVAALKRGTGKKPGARILGTRVTVVAIPIGLTFRLDALSVHTDTGNATGLARGQVVHPIRRLIIPDIGRACPIVASAVQAFVVVAVIAQLPFIVDASAACAFVAILASALIAIVLADHV
jgi:hypothetical protein